MRIEISFTNRILEGIKETKTRLFSHLHDNESHCTLNFRAASILPLIILPIPSLIIYPTDIHFKLLQMQALHNGNIKMIPYITVRHMNWKMFFLIRRTLLFYL